MTDPLETTPARPDADRTAEFVHLLTQSERRVYGFILSLITNWADADEIMQETNVRLWNEFRRYTSGTDFGAWACMIAKFQVLTYLKRKGRERVEYVEFSPTFIEHVAGAEPAAEEHLAARHTVLAACLEKVSPRNQEILFAYYQADATMHQLAERFKRSQAALYQVLSRVRRFLQQCVDEQVARNET